MKSPIEKVMAKLQSVMKRKTLPKDAFTDLNDVITLLGSSTDLFKPAVEAELAAKQVMLDTDTERWIVDLVNGDAQGPQHGRLKSSDMEPALHSIPETSKSG